MTTSLKIFISTKSNPPAKLPQPTQEPSNLSDPPPPDHKHPQNLKMLSDPKNQGF